MAEMATKTALQHSAEGYEVANVERSTGERWVTMSNALIRAAHGLTHHNEHSIDPSDH